MVNRTRKQRGVPRTNWPDLSPDRHASLATPPPGRAGRPTLPVALLAAGGWTRRPSFSRQVEAPAPCSGLLRGQKTERFERQQHSLSVRIRATCTTTAGDVAIKERVFGRKLH